MDPEMALMLIRAATDPSFAAQLDKAGIPPPTQLLAGSMAPPMGLGAGSGSGVPGARPPTKVGPGVQMPNLGGLINGGVNDPNAGPHGAIRNFFGMNPPPELPPMAGRAPLEPSLPMPAAPQVDPFGGWGATITPATQPAGVGATGLPGTQPGAAPGDDIVAAALAAEAAKGAQPGGMTGQQVSALSGLIAPKPVQPIMPTGAPPKAPEVTVKGAPGQELQHALQMLLARSQGPVVGSLGSMVRGAV